MRAKGKETFRDLLATPSEDQNNPQAARQDSAAVWRIFQRYMLGPRPYSTLIAILLAGVGGLNVYIYALATRYIADDIVQIHLQTPQAPSTTASGLMNQTLHHRTSWTQRLDNKPGISVAEKTRRLAWLALIILALELLRHGILVVVFDKTINLTQNTAFLLRNHLHDKLHALSLPYHDAHSPGRLLTHLFSDISTIQNFFTQIMRQAPSAILSATVGLSIVFWLDWQLALCVAVALPAYAITYRGFSKHLRQINRQLREREGKLNAHIANRVSFFHLTKAFGREIGECLGLVRQASPLLRRHVAAGLLNIGFTTCCAIITGTTTTTILWLATLRCRDGAMTPGELLMFYGATAHLFNPVAVLINQTALWHRLAAACRKAVHVLDEPIVVLNQTVHAQATPKQACEIKFDHVTLQYPQATSPALKEVSFTLPAGQSLCIMGPSGAGKSSLAKLIARFYDPTEGAIFLDGINLKEFNLRPLRDLVRYVNQEPIVFSGTLEDNIRYGYEDANLPTIVRSAQHAQIHDFINHLPAKYQSLTHERGLTLSGGQKQRVNLARALVSNPKVLVLDDFTSALDAHTEAKLIEGFDDLLTDRTSVLVTHRISVALACDWVLMLEAGRVQQIGKPKDLLDQLGPFQKVYQQQLDKSQQAQTQTSVA